MKIYWTRSATRDLRAVEAYIAENSPYYAREFVSKILAGTRKLASFPRIGRRVPESDREDIRELIFQGYRIIYQEGSDSIRILAVFHGSFDLAHQETRPWLGDS
jgi:toxin ParE1/3/4